MTLALHGSFFGAALAAQSGSTTLWVLLAVAVVAVAAAGVGAVTIVRTRRRLHDAEEQLYSDELTGVGNRRRLDRDLAVEAAQADTPVAVIKIDVDHFHRINDAHGRAVGDAVLRKLAGVMRAQVRVGDVVYRYDGEEFCVLLARATSGEAGQVAERIRTAVVDLQTELDEAVSVSIGVALGRGEHVNETMVRADDALAKSKELGCDRVTLAAQPLLGPLAVIQRLDATPATFG
jgi:diguanylate cyclase (GGDEF)-like protein